MNETLLSMWTTRFVHMRDQCIFDDDMDQNDHVCNHFDHFHINKNKNSMNV